MNKQTSDHVSSIAARIMRTQSATMDKADPSRTEFNNLLADARTLAASALSQDETPGLRHGKIVHGGIHPAPAEFSAKQLSANPILQFFHYAHLPPQLQAVSKPFCDLANHIVVTLPRNAERTVALRKLLEGKDAAVRANLPTPGTCASVTHTYPDDFKPEVGEPVETGGHDEDRDGPIKFGS